MINSTVATLECAAQVTAAAITMHSTGSPVIDCSRVRTIGASSAGALVTIRMCKASSMSPRPIAMRPAFLVRELGPKRKAARPNTNSTGAIAAMLKDSTCTISVVPTLAPSMIASASRERQRALRRERRRHQRRWRCCSAAPRSVRGRRRTRRSGCPAPSTIPSAGRSRTRARCRSGPCAGPRAATRRHPSDRELRW